MSIHQDIVFLINFTLIQLIIMVIEIRKNAKEEEVKTILKKITSTTKKNASKFFGKIKNGTDGLNYQRKLRNEWK